MGRLQPVAICPWMAAFSIYVEESVRPTSQNPVSWLNRVIRERLESFNSIDETFGD